MADFYDNLILFFLFISACMDFTPAALEIVSLILIKCVIYYLNGIERCHEFKEKRRQHVCEPRWRCRGKYIKREKQFLFIILFLE